MHPEAELKIIIENHPELAWLSRRYEAEDATKPSCPTSRAYLMLDLSYSIMGLDRASADCFRSYSLDAIVDYLSHSHKYYLNRALPSIASNLERLIQNDPKHTYLLRAVAGLFRNFYDNLVAHILWEEQGLLHYAKALSSCQKSGGDASILEDFKLSAFCDQHPDHRDELSQLGKLLSKLDKLYAGDMAFRMVKKQIADLESDLNLHGLIEDEVLLEKVSVLQRKLSR